MSLRHVYKFEFGVPKLNFRYLTSLTEGDHSCRLQIQPDSSPNPVYTMVDGVGARALAQALRDVDAFLAQPNPYPFSRQHSEGEVVVGDLTISVRHRGGNDHVLLLRDAQNVLTTPKVIAGALEEAAGFLDTLAGVLDGSQSASAAATTDESQREPGHRSRVSPLGDDGNNADE